MDQTSADVTYSGLKYLSTETLQQITKGLGFPARTKRADLLAGLPEALASPRQSERLERALTDDDWRVFAALPFVAGPFRLHNLLALLNARGLSFAEARDRLASWLDLGCLLPFSEFIRDSAEQSLSARALNGYTLELWFLATPLVRQLAVQHHPFVSFPVGEAPATVLPSSWNELARALFVLITEASQRPFRLRQDGTFYAQDLRRLNAVLANEPSPRKKGNRAAVAAKDEDIPPLVNWSLNLLFQLGLLEIAGPGLQVSAQAADWLARSPAEQARDLTAAWVGSPIDDFTEIPSIHAGYWEASYVWLEDYDGGRSTLRQATARNLVLLAMKLGCSADRHAWYPIGELSERLRAEHPELLFDRFTAYDFNYAIQTGQPTPARPERPTYPGIYRQQPLPAAAGRDVPNYSFYVDTDWPEVEGAYITYLLTGPLRWLGFVELGGAADQPDRFHFTPLGLYLLYGTPLAEEPAETGARVVVQPNYDVVVLDTSASLPFLAQLEQFAERRGLDRAATYRLTQDALVAGLDRGWTGQRILTTLETANGGPLPQNVAYTLREWIALYESLTLREAASLLEADSEAQLGQWLADPELAPWLGRRITPTAVLVPSQNIPSVVEILESRGSGLSVVDESAPPSKLFSVKEPDLLEVTTDLLTPYLRYRLAQFAEPREPVRGKTTYQLTPASAPRAAAAGLAGATLLTFVQQRASHGVPIEFELRLLGWSHTIAPLGHEPVVAVHLRSADLLSWPRLVTIPAIARLVRAVLNPTVALVAPSDFERLVAELSERGITVEPRALTPRQLPSGVETSPAPVAAKSAKRGS